MCQVLKLFHVLGYSKLLVIGGSTASGSTGDVEVLDLTSSTTTCDNIKSFPHVFEGAFAGLTLDKKPIICGGIPATKDCAILDNGSWQTVGQMNEFRQSAAVCESPYRSDGHSLFVTGGIGNGKVVSNSVESLNGYKWEEINPSMEESLYGHCMVLLNPTTVMVIGGASLNFSSATYLFDTEHQKWRDGPTLNVARAHHGCGRIRKNGQGHEFAAIVVGGFNGKPLDSIEILDGDKWIHGSGLPIATFGGSLVEDPTGGVLYIGGQTENDAFVDKIYRLPHAANSEF